MLVENYIFVVFALSTTITQEAFLLRNNNNTLIFLLIQETIFCFKSIFIIAFSIIILNLYVARYIPYNIKVSFPSVFRFIIWK